MNTAIIVPVVVIGLLTAACNQQVTPTPELALPELQRPTVTIEPADPKKILAVPKYALVARAGIPGVFVYRNGRARFQMVKAGRNIGERTEILSGLHGGEVLLVGDLNSVHDGSPLEPSN